ncbi:hypothetical protein P691DRAFT_801500 [Macrolepiota fuliginosa MF-IS2]|uniref:Uncharacterized protein n=1 Tax=Macrolepiota fuliginosa MF-IS2 TaxID=1400762 RepID=A0A9P6BVD6_9AGAR|nr:hypothetical protein P691DRAFT_801500 [Macrolepiota fuliginosa MF-IS2]
MTSTNSKTTSSDIAPRHDTQGTITVKSPINDTATCPSAPRPAPIELPVVDEVTVIPRSGEGDIIVEGLLMRT